MRIESIEAHLLEETVLEENMKLEVGKCTTHCYNNTTLLATNIRDILSCNSQAIGSATTPPSALTIAASNVPKLLLYNFQEWKFKAGFCWHLLVKNERDHCSFLSLFLKLGFSSVCLFVVCCRNKYSSG